MYWNVKQLFCLFLNWEEGLCSLFVYVNYEYENAVSVTGIVNLNPKMLILSSISLLFAIAYNVRFL